MKDKKDGIKTVYYSDELNDEFSPKQLEAKHIGEDYVYCHDSVWKRFTHFFWYRVVAMPLAFLYTKAVFHHKVLNAEVMKPYRKTGCFMYGNHTQDVGDALMPNMIDKRRDKYFVVNPKNLSVPLIGPITPSLGALPLPDSLAAGRGFVAAIERRIAERCAVVIYPEAHIWPYHTGIRNFPDTSFHYPVKLSTPSFCFTNTYVKRRFGKRPTVITYVDGPFFPNGDLPPRERRADLRDRIHAQMTERAKLSDYQLVRYLKTEKKT